MEWWSSDIIAANGGVNIWQPIPTAGLLFRYIDDTRVQLEQGQGQAQVTRLAWSFVLMATETEGEKLTYHKNLWGRSDMWKL